MSVTKFSSLCKCLASTKFGITVAMCVPVRVEIRSSTPTTASTDTIRLCGESLTTGQGPPLRRSKRVAAGGEEEDGSGQVLEEGRHPLPSQMEIYRVGF